MPTLLIHALTASAVQGLVCLAFFGLGINETTFFAAIMAILVDLDHRSDEERSSAVHSLFAILLASLILAGSMTLLRGTRHIIPAISIFVGFTTHVIMDMTDRKGVFIVPWSCGRVSFIRRRRHPGQPKRRRADLILAVLSGSVLLVLVCL